MRIAYVEDNPTNLALVERVAIMGHHSVVPYSEGEVAAQELLREKFDLILMDVELAGDVGGLVVVRKLRESGLKTPIVAVTAYAMMGDREKCIEAGCNDYLPKPLPINDLLAMLAKYDAALRQETQTAPPVPANTAAQPGISPALASATTSADGKNEAKPAEPTQPADVPQSTTNVQPSAVKTEETAQPVANPETSSSTGREHTE